MPISRWRPRPLCLLIAGALAVVAVSGSSHRHHPHHVHFTNWMANFGKVYESEEEHAQRFVHWLKAFELVERHKEEAKKNNLPYKLGLNEFSDRSPEEWKQQRMGHKIISPSSLFDWDWDGIIGKHKAPSTPPPPSVDWRTPEGNHLGIQAVTHVKNQFACGGCWAFATAAGVEGTVAVEQGWLNEVSPQQFVDCDSPPNEGCMGGDIQYAFRYAMKNPLVPAADYEFTNGQKACHANDYQPASRIQGYHMVPSCDEYALMTAVAQRPVVMAIAGYCDIFQSYAGGILTEGCSKPSMDCSKQLDHALVLVGYGTDNDTGIPYWIVKNSWGITWGDMGYAYIQRSVPGQHCGLGCLAYYPFYGVGGVAYVNGTVYLDDDFVDEEAQQEKIRLALTYAIYILGGTATGLLVVIAGQMVVGFVRRRRGGVPAGALREPLLNDAVIEA